MSVCYDYISPELRKKKETGESFIHKCDKRLGCIELHDGYVSPCCGVGSFDDETAANHDSGIDVSVVEHKRVIYIGHINNIFGHIITDGLRKIWFLKTCQARKLIDEKVEIVYTTNNPPLHAVAFEIWEMVGVDMSQAKFRLIDKCTRFDIIYVPDDCFFQVKYKMFTSEWAEMIDTIKANALKRCTNSDFSGNEEKVYLTRTNFKGDKIEFGEKKIMKVFEKEGFKIVSPERLSICDQISLVNNCSCLATTEGSVAHLGMFCKPKTEVVILCKSNYNNGYQNVINEYGDLNVIYIEAHKSVKASKDMPWLGPFYLCVTDYLERYLGHSVPHIPYWLCFSYWVYNVNILLRLYNKLNRLLR